MRRFFTKPENIGSSMIIIDDRDDIHHMLRVLRLSVGDEIEVSDSCEWEYRAVIKKIGKDMAEAEITDKQRFASEPDTDVTLFQGIPKQSKMDTVVQKTTELGVGRIIPLFTDRVVTSEGSNFRKKGERWNRIAAEAVKQCRRGRIPKVEEPVKLEEAAKSFTGFDLVLFPYENERGVTIKDALRDFVKCDKKPARVAVIIGPEGGFSDEEASFVIKSGGIPVSLGRTILRTETAGMAALAMVMYELEL